ncbi:MerR family transcriptional regulator [Kitasatospora purpeofusca]|uniref:MerR family transcriptional regulator n=1 Tax=Kitasatospora purpeofusca TaxID=67352 RepID=UPI002A5AC981|nr:MerR family transcriptional regulator [Kitasatospora purpeofusca]MDY0810683.1 MerR family transcriptional regulator [Kitasatospora purpeofusca]
MDRRNLLPIGQFSQASGLSVTALRHYDASGVLVPAFVDPVSGYRYFRRDQVRTAQSIRALRQLDIPVEEVGRLLGGGEEALAAALRARLRAAERRLEVQRSVVHSLLCRLTEGAGMTHRVTVRQGAAERILVRAATLDNSGLEDFLRTSYQEMYAVAGRGPLTFTGPAFVRFHGVCDDENETLVEACLPFRPDGAQPTDLPEGMTVRELPGNTLACTEVEGEAAAFPRILGGYDAVADWITEHGFAFAGPVRLVYRRWSGVPDHPDNRLEIAWPFDEPTDEPADEPAHERGESRSGEPVIALTSGLSTGRSRVDGDLGPAREDAHE